MSTAVSKIRNILRKAFPLVHIQEEEVYKYIYYKKVNIYKDIDSVIIIKCSASKYNKHNIIRNLSWIIMLL